VTANAVMRPLDQPTDCVRDESGPVCIDASCTGTRVRAQLGAKLRCHLARTPSASTAAAQQQAEQVSGPPIPQWQPVLGVAPGPIGKRSCSLVFLRSWCSLHSIFFDASPWRAKPRGHVAGQQTMSRPSVTVEITPVPEWVMFQPAVFFGHVEGWLPLARNAVTMDTPRSPRDDFVLPSPAMSASRVRFMKNW